MTPEAFVNLATGASGAVVVLAVWAWMLATGKLHSDAEFRRVLDENTKLKATQETERLIADRMTQTADVTAAVLQTLNREVRPYAGPPPMARPAGTGGD